MKSKLLTISLAALLGSAWTAKAQEADLVKEVKKPKTLLIEGQFRPRGEFRNGFKRPNLANQEPSAFIEQRTRLGLTFTDEKIRAKLSMQDVRIWGEVGQINKTDPLFSVHEAYADYMFKPTKYLRVGRQEFVYDDARILGNLDWAAQGRSHDAVKFVTTDSAGKFELHVAATWNQDGTPQEPAKLQSDNATGGGNSYLHGGTYTGFALDQPKSTQFVWFKTTYKGGNTSFLVLNDVIQDTDTSVWTRVTAGFNSKYNVGPLELYGTFYYQGGERGTNTGSVSYNGIMAALDITYKSEGKVIPTLGFNYLSGDDKKTADKVEGFNPLYGTHHAFYGLMDYFYVGNAHNGGGNEASGGLIDVYLKAVIKTNKKTKFLAHYHFFSSPTDINYTDKSGNPATTTSLGSEIDLVFVQPLGKGILLNGGFSTFIPSDGIYYAKGQNPDNGAGLNSWAWVMINFTPSVLISNL